MAARRTVWIGRAAGLASAAALLLAVSAPAVAAVSATARSDVADLVEDLTGISGLSSLVYDEIDLAEDGGGYRVTLVGARLQPYTDAHLELSDIVLTIEPEPDGYRIAGAELPSSMQILSSSGSLIGLLHVGGFGLTGKWQRSTSVLVEADLALDALMIDLLADQTAEPAQITVGTGILRSRLASTADGTWREDVDAELRDLRRQEGDAVDTLSSIALESVTEGIDLERQRLLQQLMIEASQGADSDDAAVDPAVLASMRTLSDTIRSARFELGARALEIDRGDGESVALPRVQFSQSAEGLDGPLARTGFRLEINQAEMPMAEQAAGLPEAMGPQTLELDVAIEALPWPALWEAFVDLLYASDVGEERAWQLGLALQDAGTRLRLNPSRLLSEPLTVAGDGALEADPAAVFGAVASFAFEIAGLAAAQSLAMEAPEGNLAPGLLGQLEAMGEPSAAPGGKPVHRYDIVLGADGVLTVNGEPLSLIEGPEQ